MQCIKTRIEWLKRIIAALTGTCIFGDAVTFINKDCRVLFGDIFIVPFLGPALGWTAMCSLGWGNLVAIDWNDLQVGRKLDGKLNIADLKVFTLDFASENPGAGTKLFTLQSCVHLRVNDKPNLLVNCSFKRNRLTYFSQSSQKGYEGTADLGLCRKSSGFGELCVPLEKSWLRPCLGNTATQNTGISLLTCIFVAIGSIGDWF